MNYLSSMFKIDMFKIFLVLCCMATQAFLCTNTLITLVFLLFFLEELSLRLKLLFKAHLSKKVTLGFII